MANQIPCYDMYLKIYLYHLGTSWLRLGEVLAEEALEGDVCLFMLLVFCFIMSLPEFSVVLATFEVSFRIESMGTNLAQPLWELTRRTDGRTD